MSNVSLGNSGLNISTDRVSVGSKRAPAPGIQDVQAASPQDARLPFRREVPNTERSEFVEADGKKYFLNAPRGTYVNILV